MSISNKRVSQRCFILIMLRQTCMCMCMCITQVEGEYDEEKYEKFQMNDRRGSGRVGGR